MGKKKGQKAKGGQQEGSQGPPNQKQAPSSSRVQDPSSSQQQGGGDGQGQPPDQQQSTPSSSQHQGSGDGQGPPPGQQQGAPSLSQQQGTWGPRGPPPGQQQGTPSLSQQQGTWGPRGPPPGQQQGTPSLSQQQGTWGPRGPPPGQQQGAWGPPGQQQGGWAPLGPPPGQQQGGWGPRGPPPGQQQGTPSLSQQQGAWGPRGPPPGQQQGGWGPRGPPPGQQQGTWGPRGPPPGQQQGGWGPRGPPPGQQQGAWGPRGPPPGQQQGAWGPRGPPPSQQQGPRQQESRQKETDSQSKAPKDDTSQPKSSSHGSPERILEFAPRITALKKSGKPIVVSSNFFRLVISDPNIIVYHYDVVMLPDKPKVMLRSVWNKFVSTMFPERITAFDGKNAYSKGPLVNGQTYTGSVTALNPDSNREKEFNVTITEVRRISLACFQDYRQKMLEKTLKVLPEAQMSVLDIIMRNWACDNFVASGKHFFPPASINPNKLELSKRLDMKFGYFQSAFLGYIPYLNLDISHKAFYRSCRVLDILDCFSQKYTNSLDLQEFNHFIRTVKVEYELPKNPASRRLFRVNKLVDDANKQKFKKEDGTEISVAQYFAIEKKCKLTRPDLPLLWVGPTQRSIFVPMEFCRILPDQVYKGQMDPKETREMVQKATSNALQRFKNVDDMFKKANLNSRPLMKEFGLRVSDQMEKVPARILDPPTLRTSENIKVNEGVWKIRNFLEPVSLNKWCVINTDKYVRRQNVIQLQNTLKSKGLNFNMQIADPMREPMDVDPNFGALEKAFIQLKGMEMVFVIISETKGLYSRIKTICETQEGVLLTQCLKSRTLSQDPRKLSTTVENILLKVNSKLGGKNYCLNINSVPECLKGYTMIVGADVTHASPGVNIPSVAAVAVSCDPASFQYGITVRIQPKGEIIRDLQEIMAIHLKRFNDLRKRYPEKIIFFRDGVSEGELSKVLKSELLAVKNACYPHCQPKITFIVVQKRHHARFFPTRREDEQGRNLNVPVGTCVDSQIVHPRDLDFYLVSHASMLGTARPTRYRLLYDDNKLTDDEIEKLSYYLCHLFARCNRSVSYPSPTYYAHLAAFRARAYLEGLKITSDHDIPSIQKKLTDNISRIYPMFFV